MKNSKLLIVLLKLLLVLLMTLNEKREMICT